MKGALDAIVMALLVGGAAMPWGAPAYLTIALPMMAMAFVVTTTLCRIRAMSAWMVFLAGLLVDIVSSGPVGYWALLFLLGQAFAVETAQHTSGRHWLATWAAFAAIMIALAAIGQGVAAAYCSHPIDWLPIAVGAGLPIAIFPLIYATSLYPRGHHRGHSWRRFGALGT